MNEITQIECIILETYLISEILLKNSSRGTCIDWLSMLTYIMTYTTYYGNGNTYRGQNYNVYRDIYHAVANTMITEDSVP